MGHLLGYLTPILNLESETIRVDMYQRLFVHSPPLTFFFNLKNFTSLAALHGMAWGLLVRDQVLNLHPLKWKRGVLTTGPLGKSFSSFIEGETEAEKRSKLSKVIWSVYSKSRSELRSFDSVQSFCQLSLCSCKVSECMFQRRLNWISKRSSPSTHSQARLIPTDLSWSPGNLRPQTHWAYQP